jgi:hypothetical protein
MTGDDFRELALSFEGALEATHMGHPDFRANGRIFATLVGDETRGGLNLKPEEQCAVMKMHPAAFAPASGAWGRNGWTVVDLRAVTKSAVRGSMLLAWQNVTTSKPRRPAARSRRPSLRPRTKRTTRRPR